MTSRLKLQWSEKFRIGDKNIDRDHEYLFELHQQISEIEPVTANPDVVLRVLNNLLDYTQTHFRDEEALMQRINYDQYEEHAKCHVILIRQVEDLLGEFKLGYAVALEDVLNLLQSWLENHILREDLRMAAAIAEESAKNA